MANVYAATDGDADGTDTAPYVPPGDLEERRPWATHADVTHCPHCGEEATPGHYVCWNCSNDVREPTEQQVHSEFEAMVARTELANERRNMRASMAIAAICVAAALLSIAVWWETYPGLPFLFGIFAAMASAGALRSRRRIGRIEKADLGAGRDNAS